MRELCEEEAVSEVYGLSLGRGSVAVSVLGRDNVDVEDCAVGLFRRSFSSGGGFTTPGLTSPVTPLVMTCGWTPKKGTSRPIIPMMLC